MLGPLHSRKESSRTAKKRSIPSRRPRSSGQVAQAADKTLQGYAVGAAPLLNQFLKRVHLAALAAPVPARATSATCRCSSGCRRRWFKSNPQSHRRLRTHPTSPVKPAERPTRNSAYRVDASPTPGAYAIKHFRRHLRPLTRPEKINPFPRRRAESTILIDFNRLLCDFSTTTIRLK